MHLVRRLLLLYGGHGCLIRGNAFETHTQQRLEVIGSDKVAPCGPRRSKAGNLTGIGREARGSSLALVICNSVLLYQSMQHTEALHVTTHCSRRSATAPAAATAAGVAMAAGTDVKPESSSEHATDQVDVLVLGAGVAGLAAAAALSAHGLSVLVLEGRDRIGQA
jgi:hypothetical protein